MPVIIQLPVIQWLTIVTKYHICISFVVLYKNQSIDFSRLYCFIICHVGPFMDAFPCIFILNIFQHGTKDHIIESEDGHLDRFHRYFMLFDDNVTHVSMF